MSCHRFFAYLSLLGLGLCLPAGVITPTLHAATVVAGPRVQSISTTNATVIWSTDVATRGVVRFGLSLASLDQTAEEEEVQGKHSVTLGGLRPGTRYHYVVSTARVPLATNSFITPATSFAGPSGPSAPGVSPPRESVVVPGIPKLSKTPGGPEAALATPPRAPPTRQTWGQMASLQDHFDRHGPDFKSSSPDEYARQAWEFLQRARVEGLPAKVDDDGVVRIYDPKTRAFAAYNRNGTTKTYFKPNSRDYFERQPGRSIDARTLKF